MTVEATTNTGKNQKIIVEVLDESVKAIQTKRFSLKTILNPLKFFFKPMGAIDSRIL